MIDFFRELTDAEMAEDVLRERERLRRGMMRNPGAEVLGRLALRLADRGGVRGMIVGDDLVWWDSGLGSHFSGALALGFAPGRRLVEAEIEMHALLRPEFLETVRLHYARSAWDDPKRRPPPIAPDGMVYASAHGDVALRFVREHQSLAGCWDEDGYLEWSGAARFDPGLQ